MSTLTGHNAMQRPQPQQANTPPTTLVTIDDPIFGGWAKAQPEHFGDGGVFDQIYKPGN